MTINMRKPVIMAAATLLLLALAIPVLTTGAIAGSPYEQQVLQARYDMVSARVSFASGVLADTASLIANASGLTAHVDKLNGDLNTLKGYVNANDRDGFNGYISGTIQPDMKSALDALKADMQQFRAWGVSAGTLKQLRDDYRARKSTYEQQTNAAIVELGNVRLTYYNDAMAKDDDRMSKLSAKGVDVSGMQSVRAGAESNVAGPLKSAVTSGNSEAVKAELTGKCLGNGAPYSFHFYAKSDLEALKATSAKVGASTNNSAIHEQLAGVNSKLAQAESTLNAVGANPYTAGQQSQVWDSLKAASEGLKTIIQEMNRSQNGQG